MTRKRTKGNTTPTQTRCEICGAPASRRSIEGDPLLLCARCDEIFFQPDTKKRPDSRAGSVDDLLRGDHGGGAA